MSRRIKGEQEEYSETELLSLFSDNARRLSEHSLVQKNITIDSENHNEICNFESFESLATRIRIFTANESFSNFSKIRNIVRRIAEEKSIHKIIEFVDYIGSMWKNENKIQSEPDDIRNNMISMMRQTKYYEESPEIMEERIKKMDVMNPSEVTLCWFNGLVFHQDRKYLEKIRPIINSSEFWLKIILIQHFDRIVNLVDGLRRAIHDVTNCSN